MAEYSIQDGRRIVKTARHAVELYLTTHNLDPKILEASVKDLKQKAGLFISIENYPTWTPRGGAGTLKSSLPLFSFIAPTAIAAAAEDPTMVPLSHMELEHMVLVVSMPSEPTPIKHHTEATLKKYIKLGRDGVHVEYGYHQASILPDAALKNNWALHELLDSLCMKANLPRHALDSGAAKLYTFRVQTFKELSPGGDIEEVKPE